MKFFYALLICLLLEVSVSPGIVRSAEPVKIVAASNLVQVLPELLKDTGFSYNLTFTASGTAAHQIIRGAGYDLFLSADEKNVFILRDKGLTQGEGAVFAKGRLVFFVSKRSPINAIKDLDELIKFSGNLRLALADPELAPFGIAARQYLISAGLWDAPNVKYIFGESVAGTALYVLTGTVDGAFLAASQLYGGALSDKGRAINLKPGSYDSEVLKHRMVIIKNSNSRTKEIYDYILSPAASAKLKNMGFDPVNP